ncbi:Rho guanyl nucleotide exchange [Grosmannia clavigera kw1407]|uniref:Rho guanyl nucleotide exchange n=1 Tax=Grosmannia clavigera (strain kw1407 / UAMH 11150) TaxID=655863 RepID=F0XK56_GROCL|nr:Rho guanyl nucleotide exchange [Grosmannia clavigera kw1407]EFX01990.1 Rho guanyl nucleotide exchange [Grosmannia clavigera kw1407]
MSFRGDDQRRQGTFGILNNGSYFDDDRDQPSVAHRSEDELFFSGNPDVSPSQAVVSTRPSAYGGSPTNSAMSGYQHQYQTQTQPAPSAYNPQVFPRSQSQSLPYHPHPSTRLASPTTSSAPPFPSPQQSYTPAAYNPAAYAGTNAAVPQRTATHSGHGSYQNSYNAPAVQQPALPPSPQSYIQQQQQHYASGAHYANTASTTMAPYESVYTADPPGANSYSSSTSAYSAIESVSAPITSPAATVSSGASISPYAMQSTMTSQAPYPTYGHMPSHSAGSHSISGTESAAFAGRVGRSDSTTSPLSSPLGHSSSPLGLQRHPTNAPLPSRPPMDNVLEESAWQQGASDIDDGNVTQDSLFHDIEADLGLDSPGNGSNGRNGEASEDLLFRHSSQASTHPSTHWSSGTSTIGRTPSTASTATSAYPSASTNPWEEDSDPEGALGVYEMWKDDLDAQRFSVSSGTSVPSGYNGMQSPPPVQRPDEQNTSDSDIGTDITSFIGGYPGNLTYGGQFGSEGADDLDHPPQSTTPRPHGNGTQYAPFREAEMDYGGTGGLQNPIGHRLSFDKDDERVSLGSGLSGSDSPQKDDGYPDMFYHPGISNRPLPTPPSAPVETSNSNELIQARHAAARVSYHQHTLSHGANSRSSVYHAQQELQLQQQLLVERSTSMSSHSTTPVVQVPGRSRTDAAEERKKAQRLLAAQQGLPYDSYESNSATSMTYDVITLPSGRRRKFVPSKLSPVDFRRCLEPWALSSIARWIREMADGEPDLKRKTIEEGLVALFITKVPTMNVADAETLADMVADSMSRAGILIPEEEWVRFGPGEISGVLWQLTGSGCYASRLHEHETAGRCYSHYCTRTLRKADLNGLMAEESSKKEDWMTFYKITEEMRAGKPRKEVERQNNLHEIVTSEEDFSNQLEVLRVLYKDQLLHWKPPIIPPNRLEKFVDTVFGKVESMQRVNKDHLLAQLKYRQNEQGPWIMGFSDIFREWIRKAKDEYIAYSAQYPIASFTVRKEASRNMLFRQFLEHVRNNKRSDRLGWDTFLKAPITRLQRYSLLLSTVLKNTLQDSEEKVNLARAIEEIRAVTKECDRLVDEMGKKVSLQELQNQLVFRPGSQTVLNLDHLGRELLMQGDLQRMGSKGVRWVDTHALLFDHYFILTKVIGPKDGRGDKKYDVSKEPIPMPLLLLESMNDDPISKQKGLVATPLTRSTVASVSDTMLNKVSSIAPSRPELDHAATSSSINSLARLAPGTQSEEGKTLYPFRVKHLGHEIYTLYATTPQSRQDWCAKIVEAKTRHARALAEQNAEPFRLRVLSDCGFAYDSITASSKLPSVSIPGTPLDRSIREMGKVFGTGRAPPPVCRASVNCATGFTAFEKSIIAVGTDFGVYISDAGNPRGWLRSVQLNKVTQITVLEEFSICLILADKSLISYPLDLVAPVGNYPASNHDSPRHAPQRLAKDVSFFATARMKERMLLFYKRKEGMHNTFKVLEPVFQKASEKKSRFFGTRRGAAGATETFRDFDEFYLPIECFSLNLFQSYVAVSTAKGIELLTLDRKQPMSVPCDLALPAIANIAARLRDQRPLGMFRLNDQEFLLAYEDCAVYADKHGEVSRTLIMEYSGRQKKAKAATMFGQYLLLFNEDYVEVRNAENGRLRQIIAGIDVRCLDYGFRGPTGGDNASATTQLSAPLSSSQGQMSNGSVKICMAHPEQPGMQIVLELLLNDGHSEKS